MRLGYKLNCFKTATTSFHSNTSKRWKPRLHAYNLNFWQSVDRFSRVLLDNILFNEDGLVMINKPYGVGVHDPSKLSSKHSIMGRTLNTAASDRDFYMDSALPRLREELGYPELSIVKAPERYTSGVTILSANDVVKSRVQKSMRKSKNEKHFSNAYLTVVLGSPVPPTLLQKVALKMEVNPIGEGKKPMILTSWTKNAASRNEVFPVRVEHRTLQQAPLASLVEIRPSLTKWHFLRVYMAYLLSPILGDHLYGSRVQNVFGVPLSVNPFSDVAEQHQRLSKELLAALALRAREEVIIPTHIHLYQVRLLDFKGKNGHVEVHAPLPESFLWTCKQLHLQHSQEVIHHFSEQTVS